MKSTANDTFKSSEAANYVVDRLLELGIHRDDISVLMSSHTHEKEFDAIEDSHAPEGIATGAILGGGLGGIVGALTSIGTIAITGGAGLVAAGPLASALLGLGAGAGTGGLLGGLIGLGFDETEAKRKEKDISDGHIVIAAHVDSNLYQTVQGIFDEAHEREEHNRQRRQAVEFS